MPKVWRTIIFFFIVIAMQFVAAVWLRFTPLRELDFDLQLILSQLLAFAVSSVLYVVVTRQKFSEVIPLKWVGVVNVVLIVFITLAVIPASWLVSYVSGLFFVNHIEGVVISIAGFGFLRAFLAIAITPSICEELVARGVFMHDFKKKRPWVQIVASGLLFGLLHLNFQQFFYTFFLGCVFGWLVYKTGSVISAMLAHLVVNGLAVVQLMFIDVYEVAEATATLEEVPQIAIVAVFSGITLAGLVFGVGLLVLFNDWNNNRNRKLSQPVRRVEWL